MARQRAEKCACAIIEAVPVHHQLKSSRSLLSVFLPVFGLLIGELWFSSSARPDAFEDAARDLVQKMTSVLAARESVTLSVQNRSSLGIAEATMIRRAIENALTANGVRLSADGPAMPHISVVFSETLAGYVCIAEVRRNDSSKIFMVKVRRDAAVHPSPEPASFVIRRELLWEQTQPILDVGFSSKQLSARKMLVLEPREISVLRWQGDGWIPDSAIALPRTTAQRDERGFLNFATDPPSVSFEKEVCRQSAAVTLEFRCGAAIAGQRFLPGEGRFTAQLNEIEKKTGARVSSARLDLPEGPISIVTSLDGLARMYENDSEPVATFAGWGSELAAVHSGCRAGWQLLVTGKGDWTMPDTMQAYEIRDRRAVPVSVPVEFAGPIVSLRGSDNSRDALAVVKNLATQHYEAYHVSIACEK